MQAGCTHTLAPNNPSDPPSCQHTPGITIATARGTGMQTPSALVKLHFSEGLLQDLLEYLIAKEAKKTFDLDPDLVE